MRGRGWPGTWRRPGRRRWKNARHVLDCNTLTLGFARRFVSYKRPNLLLHDPQRLVRLLTHPQRPVQLILAGKAHPDDQIGQAMIRQWVEFVRRPEVRQHAVFLAGYDMQLTEHLAQGVDIWLNTPRRPWEACGTSGMKVLVNGGLNTVVLDGCWAEAYTPEVVGRWAMGTSTPMMQRTTSATPRRSTRCWRTRWCRSSISATSRALPPPGVARMRQSMAQLTPRYSAARTVREYTERHYLPAASAYRERAAGQGARAAELVGWRRELDAKWSALRIGQRPRRRPARARDDAAGAAVGGRGLRLRLCPRAAGR